jgi:hypothetical protein
LKVFRLTALNSRAAVAAASGSKSKVMNAANPYGVESTSFIVRYFRPRLGTTKELRQDWHLQKHCVTSNEASQKRRYHLAEGQTIRKITRLPDQESVKRLGD